MEKIFIKPAIFGNVVRHPEKISHKISDDGELVIWSSKWQRYLDAGDIVIIENNDAKKNIKE